MLLGIRLRALGRGKGQRGAGEEPGGTLENVTPQTACLVLAALGMQLGGTGAHRRARGGPAAGSGLACTQNLLLGLS